MAVASPARGGKEKPLEDDLGVEKGKTKTRRSRKEGRKRASEEKKTEGGARQGKRGRNGQRQRKRKRATGEGQEQVGHQAPQARQEVEQKRQGMGESYRNTYTNGKEENEKEEQSSERATNNDPDSKYSLNKQGDKGPGEGPITSIKRWHGAGEECWKI